MSATAVQSSPNFPAAVAGTSLPHGVTQTTQTCRRTDAKTLQQTPQNVIFVRDSGPYGEVIRALYGLLGSGTWPAADLIRLVLNRRDAERIILCEGKRGEKDRITITRERALMVFDALGFDLAEY